MIWYHRSSNILYYAFISIKLRLCIHIFYTFYLIPHEYNIAMKYTKIQIKVIIAGYCYYYGIQVGDAILFFIERETWWQTTWNKCTTTIKEFI